MSVDMSKHFSTSALIRFTLPTIAMMIFTSCYTIVDGFFVSNYAGKTALAAVNLIFPAVMILASVGMMIGTGGSALVAKTLGEGDRPRARRHFSLLIIFAFVVGSVLSLGGWFFMEPTATMLGATPGSQMHHDAALYGRMMMISLPFFILQYAFQSFFVTAGKPKYGFLVIVAAGVANILLDFLFVGVFGWGLPGAALATNIGELIGGGIPLVYFARKRSTHLYFDAAASALARHREGLRQRLVGNGHQHRHEPRGHPIQLAASALHRRGRRGGLWRHHVHRDDLLGRVHGLLRGHLPAHELPVRRPEPH